MFTAFINANPYETFSLIVVLGALFRWWHEVAAHGAPSGFADYWLKDTPQYSAGVLLATIGAWWAVIGFELFTVPAGAPPVKWQLVVSYGAITGYTINAAIAQGTASAAAAAAGKAAGFLRPVIVPLLLVLALAGAALVSAGCAGIGPQAAVPKTLPEQIEAANLLADHLSDAIVDLTCAQFRAGECIEPGKPLMPKDAIAAHDAVERAHAALSAAASIGAGQVGECMGSQRTQSACLAAANAVLLEIDRKLIAKRGSR